MLNNDQFIIFNIIEEDTNMYECTTSIIRIYFFNYAHNCLFNDFFFIKKDKEEQNRLMRSDFIDGFTSTQNYLCQKIGLKLRALWRRICLFIFEQQIRK